MAGKEPRYEATEIKAIRGTESKAIANKQQDGWELVSQQQGPMRTTLSFRRPKPPTPWKMWATIGGAGIILASIITVGALMEEDSASSAAEDTATASTEQPSLAPPSGDEDDPTSSADLVLCETKPGGDPCKFGQTAIYTDTVRAGEVKLEITVGAPIDFTPSESATTLYDRPLQPVNVYFPVTVRNISPALAVDMISGRATNAEQGESDTMPVSDSDIDSFAIGAAAGLPVGEAMSAKDGWSMATPEGVEYRISIDGLAGYGVKFTR